MKILTPFSYYGGKSKIAHLYPPPSHRQIIEPFGGSAAYAWRWRKECDVWINELDPRTHSIWDFLIYDEEALDKVRKYVPETVTAGQKVLDFIPAEENGLVELCRCEANQGTQGGLGVHDQITSMGAKCWKIRRKMEEVIPVVLYWRLTNWDYSDVFLEREYNSDEATWFIDPPYSNPAGKRYRQSDIDYGKLATYCKTRKGQVIVCENAGADWLPFEPFEHKRVSIRSRYQKANAQEVIWYKADDSFTICQTCQELTCEC